MALKKLTHRLQGSLDQRPVISRVQHMTTKAAMKAEPALPSMAKLPLMDRVKATNSIKVVVLCHPKPLQGH